MNFVGEFFLMYLKNEMGKRGGAWESASSTLCCLHVNRSLLLSASDLVLSQPPLGQFSAIEISRGRMPTTLSQTGGLTS